MAPVDPEIALYISPCFIGYHVEISIDRLTGEIRYMSKTNKVPRGCRFHGKVRYWVINVSFDSIIIGLIRVVINVNQCGIGSCKMDLCFSS